MAMFKLRLSFVGRSMDLVEHEKALCNLALYGTPALEFFVFKLHQTAQPK